MSLDRRDQIDWINVKTKSGAVMLLPISRPNHEKKTYMEKNKNGDVIMMTIHENGSQEDSILMSREALNK